MATKLDFEKFKAEMLAISSADIRGQNNPGVIEAAGDDALRERYEDFDTPYEAWDDLIETELSYAEPDDVLGDR